MFEIKQNFYEIKAIVMMTNQDESVEINHNPNLPDVSSHPSRIVRSSDPELF